MSYPKESPIEIALTVAGIIAFLCVSIWSVSCGPFKIEHDVSGTVNVTTALTPGMFEPFFLTDCATRVSGQQCYDVDPATCSKCMATALFDTLPAAK